MEAAAKTGANVQDQVRLSAELWTLVVGTAFPIHTLDPKYGPLVNPIVDPLAGRDVAGGGYGAGGRVELPGNTGGIQLDGQQGGTSYTNPEHQLNPGSMYSERPKLVTNGKHIPGQPGYNSSAGTQPPDAAIAYEGAIKVKDSWWAKSSDGKSIYRYFYGNDGTVHWTGSTRDERVPLKRNQVPAEVLKEFGFKAKGSNKPW